MANRTSYGKSYFRYPKPREDRMIPIGTKVLIFDYNKGWSEYSKTVGKVGTIAGKLSTNYNYPVVFDDIQNTKPNNCMQGAFWIKAKYIRIVEMPESDENEILQDCGNVIMICVNNDTSNIIAAGGDFRDIKMGEIVLIRTGSYCKYEHNSIKYNICGVVSSIHHTNKCFSKDARVIGKVVGKITEIGEESLNETISG